MADSPTANSESPDSIDEVISFVDRRGNVTQRKSAGIERRQFSNTHNDLTEDAAELGRAIDAYKLNHRRRFINYEEMLQVIKGLGYRKG
jgi:hypothetical protein